MLNGAMRKKPLKPFEYKALGGITRILHSIVQVVDATKNCGIVHFWAQYCGEYKLHPTIFGHFSLCLHQT